MESSTRVAAGEGVGGTAESAARLLEKHQADIEALMAREQVRSAAIATKLAERAANEPRLMVGMSHARNGPAVLVQRDFRAENT